MQRGINYLAIIVLVSFFTACGKSNEDVAYLYLQEDGCIDAWKCKFTPAVRIQLSADTASQLVAFKYSEPLNFEGKKRDKSESFGRFTNCTVLNVENFSCDEMKRADGLFINVVSDESPIKGRYSPISSSKIFYLASLMYPTRAGHSFQNGQAEYLGYFVLGYIFSIMMLLFMGFALVWLAVDKIREMFAKD